MNWEEIYDTKIQMNKYEKILFRFPPGKFPPIEIPAKLAWLGIFHAGICLAGILTGKN